jgi:hypothetical protein
MTQVQRFEQQIDLGIHPGISERLSYHSLNLVFGALFDVDATLRNGRTLFS